jgi:hypothetical protein
MCPGVKVAVLRAAAVASQRRVRGPGGAYRCVRSESHPAYGGRELGEFLRRNNEIRRLRSPMRSSSTTPIAPNDRTPLPSGPGSSSHRASNITCLQDGHGHCGRDWSEAFARTGERPLKVSLGQSRYDVDTPNQSILALSERSPVHPVHIDAAIHRQLRLTQSALQTLNSRR